MTLVRKDKTGGFLEVRHYKDLLIQLVSRDLKLKYRRSFLGYVWSVLNPLLIMIVMYVVFLSCLTETYLISPYIFLSEEPCTISLSVLQTRQWTV